MLIKSVHIRNLCSILDATLACEQLTVLVGRNGAGKSTFLRAIELFYASSPKLAIGDFYAEDPSNDVVITVTFCDLPQAAEDQFGQYVEGGELTVSRVLSLAGGKFSARYFGSTLQNPDFAAVRGSAGARELTAAYRQLQERDSYRSLPTARSKDAAIEEMRKWEMANPSECTRERDEGQFFGFAEVAQGYLGRFTRLIRIPAVRDAGLDAAEGRGSPITELMDLAVRKALAEREELVRLRADVEERYQDLVDPAKSTELADLARGLDATLRTYVPDSQISLSWVTGGGIQITLPKADVKIVEDGYPSPVERTGHGTQRAFTFTLLQHLAYATAPVQQAATEVARTPDSDVAPAVDTTAPSLVLLIEEPELYQHPNRQRHFADVLRKLASGFIPGVASQTQVMYCTHSPLFVGLDRFDQIRRVTKTHVANGRPRATSLASAPLEQIAEELWAVENDGRARYTAETLRPRLQTIMTPWMNEGFFSDTTVLVEGEGDRAALLAVAASLDHNMEADGIAIIPCGGKTNLDRPFLIFRALGIPTYIVWDGDYEGNDAKPELNRKLLRLVGQTEEDWPYRCEANCACFKTDLERTLRAELGPELFDRLIKDKQVEFGLKKKEALKSPVVLRAVLNEARAQGQTSPSLEAMVGRIIALRVSGATRMTQPSAV